MVLGWWSLSAHTHPLAHTHNQTSASLSTTAALRGRLSSAAGYSAGYSPTPPPATRLLRRRLLLRRLIRRRLRRLLRRRRLLQYIHPAPPVFASVGVCVCDLCHSRVCVRGRVWPLPSLRSVGACVWPWLLTYLLTSCRRGSSLHIYRRSTCSGAEAAYVERCDDVCIMYIVRLRQASGPSTAGIGASGKQCCRCVSAHS